MKWLLSRLKGGNMTAQGNALGLAIQEFTFALKGPGKEIPWLHRLFHRETCAASRSMLFSTSW
jgi:hypothetical protein